MRCCKASTARIFTLFTLVVLLSHSFGSVHAQSSSGQALSIPGVTTTPDTPAPSSTPAASSSTPAASGPAASSTPAPASAPQSAASSQSAAAPNGSSSAASAAQSSASSTASSGSSSSASSSSASSTASSTSASSQSSAVTDSKSNTVTALQPTVTGSNGGHTSYAPVSGQFSVPQPSDTSSDASTPTGASQAAAPKSFLENKGAMAGAFGVAGVIGALIIIFVVMKIMQRRARARDEEEGEYFEKYDEPSGGIHANHGNNDSSWNLAAAPAMSPARNDAYLDRTVHYGSAQATQDYNAPRQHEYPPGTAYAAAAGGSQYQYTGYGSTTTYGTAPSPTGSHPFADPQNVPRANARAPPVSHAQRPPTQVGDAYDGIDDGYAQ